MIVYVPSIVNRNTCLQESRAVLFSWDSNPPPCLSQSNSSSSYLFSIVTEFTIVFITSNVFPVTTKAPSCTDSLVHVGLSSVLEAVYYIGLKQCKERWRRVFDWTKSHNIITTPIFGIPCSDINLIQPPIPIVNMAAKDKVAVGQVAYATSHTRALWHALEHNYSREIALEEEVKMKDALLVQLP